MFKVILAIILTSSFFILFFESDMKFVVSKNKSDEIVPASKFIEDSREFFNVGKYPYDLMDSKYIYGDIGTFTGYSSVPEDHWLHGFPHEKTK